MKIHVYHGMESSKFVVSQVSYMYQYYFTQLSSPLKVINPNEFSPQNILKDEKYLYVLNSPFTKEKLPRLEAINELGFLILYPKLKDRVDKIDVYRSEWLMYIEQNFSLDTSFVDDNLGHPIAYKFIRK